MLKITRHDVVDHDRGPLGPAIPFTAELDGVEVAHGNLMTKSWMGDETGRLVNVRWTEGHLDAARQVLAAIVAAASPGDVLNAATNADIHPDPAERVALFESSGFELWQEKEGFLWSDEGQDLPEPDRVTVRAVTEADTEHFAAVFTAVASDTLDRIDADTVAKMGLAAWAAAFIASEDEATWLLAENAAGEPVGLVGVREFDDPALGTIAHIAVVPKHRGHGYVDQLLRAANRTARELGFTSMLSDSDTLNAPMHAALRRNGHSPEATAWHKWMHRRTV